MMRLQTDMLLGIEDNRARARHTLNEGEEVYCTLSWDAGLTGTKSVEEANQQLNATTRFWRNWIGSARIPDHEFRPLV